MSKGDGNDNGDGSAAQKNAAAELSLRQNLSRETEDETVGTGLLAIHQSRVDEQIIKKRKKEREASSAHTRLINQIDARIAELDKEISFWENKAEDAQEKIDGLEKELSQLQEGSEEYKAKQKEIEEQERIRDEALKNVRQAKAEKDALLKIENHAKEIGTAIEKISDKGVRLDTQKERLDIKATAIHKTMSDNGINDAMLLAIASGDYTPNPHQSSIIEEYYEITEEFSELNDQLAQYNQEIDGYKAQLQENQKTIYGQKNNNETISLAAGNGDGIETGIKLFEAAGATKQETSRVKTESNEWNTDLADFSDDLGGDIFATNTANKQITAEFNVATGQNDAVIPELAMEEYIPPNHAYKLGFT